MQIISFHPDTDTEPITVQLQENRKTCKFDKDGICTALACYYSQEKCNARDEKGDPKYVAEPK